MIIANDGDAKVSHFKATRVTAAVRQMTLEGMFGGSFRDQFGVVFGVVLVAAASAVSGCHLMVFCGRYRWANAFRPAKVTPLVTGFRHDHVCT